MGFDDGQIILESENGAYYAGQTVRGRMVFTQNKIKEIHGIYVDIKGFCKVHWTTSRSRRVNGRTVHNTVHHYSHEEYFKNRNFLFGNENGENTLNAGQHEFHFACPIPPNCPATFEGTYGHIRYRVKVVMLTIGMFSLNKDKWVPVKVHVPIDLNQNPSCREPMDFDLSSTYCCWCMKAGSSQVLVRLPVSGYCPGQIIPIDVSCQNDSSVEIDEIKLAIKKYVKYTAVSEPGTRHDHDTVAEIKKGPIPGRTTRNWTVEMEVPAMDIYNVDACRYIDINYHFKVSTEVGGCHKDNDESSAIIIGTIPLVGYQDNVLNPLRDQLPKSMEGVNCYPAPPIINQPLPNSPYPNGNVYPNNTPYPGGSPGFPTTPNLGGRTSPYPPGNQPYPNVSPYLPNQPYPGANSPYPGANSPYPAGSSSYPPPYSEDNSYGVNPDPVPPYPGTSPVPPYNPDGKGTSPLKKGTIGFGATEGDEAKVPLLPSGPSETYPSSSPPNPYASASAPEPSTPGNDEQKLPLGDPADDKSSAPPYNPDFIKKNDKKDEKDEKEPK